MIKMQFIPSKKEMNEAQTAAQRNSMSRSYHWLFAGLMLISGLMPILLARTNPAGLDFYMIGFMGGCALFFLPLWLQIRKIRKDAYQSAQLAQEYHMMLDADGVHASSNVGTSQTRWAAFGTVTAGKLSILLQKGPFVEFLPIRALPEGMTAQHAVDQIKRWMTDE